MNLPNDYNSTWLIGFTFDPDIENPNLFTLIFSGDEDVPLTFEEYIIFFRFAESVPDCLKLIEINANFLDLTIPKQVDLVVDIATVLYRICYENTDDSSIVLNSLNIMFDLVKATGITLPENYREKLYRFADHLTFSKDISDFFIQEHLIREDIHDAVLWCIGAIVSKSRLLESVSTDTSPSRSSI